MSAATYLEGMTIMSVYEALALMLNFGILLLALLSYIIKKK